jgi:hypothetical protein
MPESSVTISGIANFPKGHRVKLFRLVVSTRRRDYLVTNDVTQPRFSNSLRRADDG